MGGRGAAGSGHFTHNGSNKHGCYVATTRCDARYGTEFTECRSKQTCSDHFCLEPTVQFSVANNNMRHGYVRHGRNLPMNNKAPGTLSRKRPPYSEGSRSTSPKRLKCVDEKRHLAAQGAYQFLYASVAKDSKDNYYRDCFINFMIHFFVLYGCSEDRERLMKKLCGFQIRRQKLPVKPVITSVDALNLKSVVDNAFKIIFGSGSNTTTLATNRKNIRNRLRDWLFVFTISYHALLFLCQSFSSEYRTIPNCARKTTHLAICLLTHGCKSSQATFTRLRRFMVCFNDEKRREEGKNTLLALWKNDDVTGAMQSVIDFTSPKTGSAFYLEQEAEMVVSFHRKAVEQFRTTRLNATKLNMTRTHLRQRGADIRLSFAAIGLALYNMFFTKSQSKESKILKTSVTRILCANKASPASPAKPVVTLDGDGRKSGENAAPGDGQNSPNKEIGSGLGQLEDEGVESINKAGLKSNQEPTAKTLRLCTPEDMGKFSSWFSYESANDVYLLMLASFEIYCAHRLDVCCHGRTIIRNGNRQPPLSDYCLSQKEVHFITARKLDFVSEDFQVTRTPTIGVPHRAPLWEVGHTEPKVDWDILVKVMTVVGSFDTSRQQPLILGLGFLNPSGEICGFQKVDRYGDLTQDEKDHFFQEVGRLSEYACYSLQVFQDSALSPDKKRDYEYALNVRKRLFIPEEENGFWAEIVSVVLTPLHLMKKDQWNIHQDKQNDWRPLYDRSGVLSFVVMNEDCSEQYLLQLVLAHRRFIPALLHITEPNQTMQIPVFRYQLYDSTLCFLAQRLGTNVRFMLTSATACSISGKATRSSQQGTVYQNGQASLEVPRLRHRTEYFYEDGEEEHMSKSPVQKMNVLTDGVHGMDLSKCVNSSNVPGCENVINHVREVHLPVGATSEKDGNKMRLAGSLHLQCKHNSDEPSNLCFYDFHLDKLQFDFAIFVPLQSKFYTILFVPKGKLDNPLKRCSKDVKMSEALFQNLRQGLSGKDNEYLNNYISSMEAFSKNSYQRLYQTQEVEMKVFYCQPGSALCFEAKSVVHGTVTVAGNSHMGRDLMIIHPFSPHN